MSEPQTAFIDDGMREDMQLIADRTGHVNWTAIDGRFVPGLVRYLAHGVPPGSFLRAVLENNLFAAVVRADHDSLAAIREIVIFVSNYLPSRSVGSEKNVKIWIKHRGFDNSEIKN